MKKIQYLFFAALLVPGTLQAQDFKQLVKEMRQTYAESKSLQIVMDIAVYDSAQSVEPYFKHTIDIKREGTNYWYQFGENEMLMNDNYLIMLDRQSRQISCSKRSLEAEKEMQKAFKFDLDSILTLYDDPQYLGKVGNTEHYLVFEKQGPIEKIHFFVDKANYDLKRIEYKYREGQYVTINFLVFNRDPDFEDGTFSESQYILVTTDKIVPSHFYKLFHVSYY
jgi:outer membrane lipoprotein-sorting protein